MCSRCLKPPVEQSIALTAATTRRRGNLADDDVLRLSPRPMRTTTTTAAAPASGAVRPKGRRLRRRRRGAVTSIISFAISGRGGPAPGVKHARGRSCMAPGLRKTLLARELGRALGVEDDRISIVNGPELLDKFVGVAEARVRGRSNGRSAVGALLPEIGRRRLFEGYAPVDSILYAAAFECGDFR